jgi:soluble lytic murein transglycosylase-like protein
MSVARLSPPGRLLAAAVLTVLSFGFLVHPAHSNPLSSLSEGIRSAKTLILAKHFARHNPKLEDDSAARLAESVLKASDAFDVDPLLVAAVILKESRANPDALSRGNYGLMQVNWTAHSRSIRSAFGQIEGARDLFDPDTNIMVGTYLLSSYLSHTKGNVDLALNRYLGRSSPAYRNAVWRYFGEMQDALGQLVPDPQAPPI